MQLKLKKLVIDDFKGVRHAEYDFADRTHVTGANGSGKTTIADAHFWIWADKDYSLASSPEVHPNFMETSAPTVTEIVEIDGVEVEVKKIQQDARTDKQKEEGAPVRIKNLYEINGVPKSQTDFVKELTERGIDFDKFLLLSHIDIFTSQKSADCRNILFGMVSDITDKDIADSLGDCEEVAELLATYKVDEVIAMAKREKKSADEQLDAIPNQIIGLEKAKEDVDVSALTARRDAIQAEINALKAQAGENSQSEEERLKNEITSAESEIKAIAAKANAERLDALNIANNAVSEVELEAHRIKGAIEQKNNSIKNAMAHRAKLEARYNELKDEFAAVKAQVFGTENCSYCGQPLPQGKLEEMRTAFEGEQTKRKAKINSEAQGIRKELEVDEEFVHKTSAEVKELVQQQYTVTAKLDEARQRRDLYSEPVDITLSVEYKAAWDKLQSLKADLEQLRKPSESAWDVSEELVKKGHEMKDLNDQIARAGINDKVDAQIAELKERQKQVAQEKANAEKRLYQLSKISMEKNRKLTEQVNSHFKKVRFSLFKFQKNGEVVDDCTPTVLMEDGTYRNMNNAVNMASAMLAKIDIIRGLQNFYGIHIPVFIDCGESLDAESIKKIDVDAQYIVLKVVDFEPLKVRAI